MIENAELCAFYLLVSVFCQISDVVNRLTVTLPRPRDGKVRAPCIPPSVLAARAAEDTGAPARLAGADGDMDVDDTPLRQAGRKLAREIEMENGVLKGFCIDESNVLLH